MKVYVIVGCMSGEDYSTDDAITYEVCKDLETAKADFKDIISDIEDGFSDNCDYDFNDNETVYEYTDFDNDEHGIIKLVEVELK